MSRNFSIATQDLSQVEKELESRLFEKALDHIAAIRQSLSEIPDVHYRVKLYFIHAKCLYELVSRQHDIIGHVIDFRNCLRYICANKEVVDEKVHRSIIEGGA